MADIGTTLREARMRARVDVSEVEARTKIRAKYLRAIENEEWDLLPGTVYAKSFLRTYGDFLGLDSRSLIEEFKRRYEDPSDHDVLPVKALGRERDRRGRSSALPSWAPIAIVVVVIIALLFAVGIASQPGTTSTPARPLAHRPSRATRRAHTSRPAARPVRAVATVQLTPTGPVYVCLVNAAGTKLINQQTFTPGQTIPTERAGKLLLTLGNASVSMKVNGKPVAVTPSATAIRLAVTPRGVRHIPLSQRPTCP